LKNIYLQLHKEADERFEYLKRRMVLMLEKDRHCVELMLSANALRNFEERRN